MFVLKRKELFLVGVRTSLGALCGVMSAQQTDAKVFRTKKAAEAFMAKWTGAGVGVEGFEVARVR